MTRKLVIIGWVIFSIGLAYGQAPTTQVSGAGGRLLQACIAGNARDVTALLKGNADLVNVRRVEDGATPLHLAKNAAVATVLLENGADIEALDTQTKSTPLHWALDRELWDGKSDTAAYLIDQGARWDDLLCLCALGKLPELKAMIAKDPSLVNYVNLDDQLGSTPLQVASDYGQAKVVEYLLDHGAEVNKLANRRAAMHGAAFLNRIEVVKILLAHGANIDITEGHYHESPLGWAVYAGQIDMVKFLLSRGAKVHQVDIHNAQTGGQGHNDAGQGATPEDYKNIEKALRAAMATK